MAGTTLAYNTATGAKLWQSSYNPGGLSSSSFSAVAVSPVAVTVASTDSRATIFTALSSAWSAGQGPWRTILGALNVRLAELR